MTTLNLTGVNTVIPKILASLQLASGSNTIYTVPAGGAVKFGSLVLANTSAGVVSVSVSLIPSGGTGDGTHSLISAYPLEAGQSLVCDELTALKWAGDGDQVRVTVDTATAVDATLTGLEFG